MNVGKWINHMKKYIIAVLVNLLDCNFIFEMFLIVKYNTDTEITTNEPLSR